MISKSDVTKFISVFAIDYYAKLNHIPLTHTWHSEVLM